MTNSLEEYLKSWLTKSEHDLKSAYRLIEIEPMILDTACFHCQQAVEKCLKAFLLFHGQEVERTHDIDFLMKHACAFDHRFCGVDTMNLSEYAVAIRYPDTNLIPDKEDALKFLRMAEWVNEIVRSSIKFPTTE